MVGERHLGEVPTGVEAIVGMSGERSSHGVAKRFRAVLQGLTHRPIPAANCRVEGLELARPAEGTTADQHLVEHDSQGEDVGAGVDASSVEDLFRCHVARRAHLDAGAGVPLPVVHGHLGDAEVGHLCEPALRGAREQDVRWLEIPM